jgi:hypothetical protein
VALLAAAAAVVGLVPDDSTGAVVAQALGAGLLGATAAGLLVGGSVLDKFQVRRWCILPSAPTHYGKAGEHGLRPGSCLL